MMICGSEEKRKTKLMDNMLKKDFADDKKVIKLLLLGAAEGGKSTILKQMKILHNNGYSEEELCNYRPTVYQNIATGIQSIVHGMHALRISFQNLRNERAAMEVDKWLREEGPWLMFNPALVEAICSIWQDPAVQAQVVPRGAEFQFMESTPYFLNAINRIAEPDYVPTVQDILMLRVHTTGVVEITFEAKSRTFNVFDVGGQRSERRKWIHCFDNVNAIIFVAALSEFDQVCGEDSKTNRMIESLTLFRSVCNSRYFFATSMILFLNKRDLFLKQIAEGKSIACVLKDYHGASGSNSYAEQVAFVREKFVKMNLNPTKEVYTHETCATDTNQIEQVLDSSLEVICRSMLNRVVLV